MNKMLETARRAIWSVYSPRRSSNVLAPELRFDGQEFNTQTDVYCYGIVLLEMLLGRVLSDESKIELISSDSINGELWSELLNQISGPYRLLIKKCCRQEITERIQLKSILKVLKRYKENLIRPCLTSSIFPYQRQS